MANQEFVDYYDVLQLSQSAEPEMIHRVYRLLAQRFHPDNKETGDPNRFRIVHEAFDTLSNPQKRAAYDVALHRQRQDRLRLISTGNNPEFAGVGPGELEKLIGLPREHLEFTVWYLVQKKLLQRDDSAQLLITAEGVDFLEKNYQANQQRKRLQAANP
jgi:curved DNA-binding protein CbpA